MHPDLSPHLHSEECNLVINAYKQCHADNPFRKFLGVCNDLDRQMNKCLAAEHKKKMQARWDHRKEVESRNQSKKV